MNKRRKRKKVRWVQDETKKLIQIPTIKREHKPTSLRALDAERAITKKLPLEEPVKHWQTEKAKRGVTDIALQKWLVAIETTAKLWSHFHWTPLNWSEPSNSNQGPEYNMPPARRPSTRRNSKGVSYISRQEPSHGSIVYAVRTSRRTY